MRRIADRVLRLHCARVFFNRLGRLGVYAAIAALAVASAPAYAFWASLAASPSPNTGDFDVTWSNPSSKYYNLQEMPSGGNWGNIAWTSGTLFNFPTHAPGDFSYRLKLTETECSGWPEPICYDVTTYSEIIAVTVDDPPPQGGPGGDPFPEPGPFTPPSTTNFPDATIVNPSLPDGDIGLNSVGALNGGGGVSGGQASYSIPIIVPPGRKGMQPSVSLNYSSSGGNGVVGVGWGLSAGSSISRCSATAAQDGFTASVQYDLNRDRLCLDRMRLMVEPGFTYGQSSARYRTELDSFARVEQFGGGINDSGTYFEVTFKNGGKSYYGNTPLTRFEAIGPNKTLTWAIQDQRDVSGNTVLYDYQSFGNGEYHISAIHYTGHNGSSGDRHVRFVYEANGDPRTYYMAGGKTRLTQRLLEIKTEYQSTLVRKYTLSYSDSLSTGRNLLRSAQECAYENGTTAHCFPATNFEWQEKATAYVTEPLQFHDPQNLIPGGTPQIVHDDKRWLHNVMPHGDVNGDGVKDWTDIHVNAEGQITQTRVIDLPTCFRRENSFTLTCLDADFDADGLTDGFRRNNDKLEIQYADDPNWITTPIEWESLGLGTGLSDTPISFADFNGDGYVDIAMRQNAQLWIYFHTTIMAAPYSVAASKRQWIINYSVNPQALTYNIDVQVYGDMDGNGTPDLVVSKMPGSTDTPGLPIPDYIFLTHSQPAGGMTTTTRDIPSQVGDPNVNSNFFHDLNGDGLTDLLSITPFTHFLQYKLNDGSDFPGAWIVLGVKVPVREGKYERILNELEVYHYPIMSKMLTLDYDGDGRDELLFADNVVASGCALVLQAPPANDEWFCDDDLYGEYQVQSASATQVPINSDVKDDSVRRYSAHRFDELANGSILATTFLTSIYASASQTAAIDATGNGLIDIVTVLGCRYTGCEFNSETSARPNTAQNSAYFEGAWINRNLGTATDDNSNSESEYAGYDLISGAQDAFGNRNEWTYKPLSSDAYDTANSSFYKTTHSYEAGDDDYFHFASSMYVVAEHKGSDGLGGLNSALYRYRGAIFNNKGRGFQGFRSIVVEQDIFADGHSLANTDKISRTDFHQKWPISSQIEQACTFLVVDNVADDNPNCSGVISLSTVDSIHDVATSGGARFVAINGQTTKSFDLATRALLTTAVTTQTFDTAGNVTYASNSHTDDWTTNLTETTNTYSLDWNGWWLNKLTSSVAKTNPVTGRHWSSPNVPSAQDTMKEVTTSFPTYDSSHRLPTEVTVTGNDTALSSTVTTVFNSYGLPTSISTTGTDVTGPRSVTTTYSKDGTSASVDGYFPYTISNVLGHEVEMHTDSALGVATDLWDANDLNTVTVHDAFGRTTDVTGPGTPTVSTRLEWCDGGVWCIAGAAYRAQTISAAIPTNYSYSDSFGRTTYAISRNFDNTAWTRVRNTFDVRGNPVLQSLPHDTSLGDPTNPGTHFDTFDALGRLTKKRVDQADGSLLKTTYSYSGFTTNIDAGGILTHRIHNGLGQLVETMDGAGGFTRYAFDGAGNPVVLQDPKMDTMAQINGNDVGIRAAFNSLGQKEWVEDPDWWNTSAGVYGRKIFSYNALGEVLSETDPNGNLIVIDYDVLGRVFTRTVNGDLDGLWAYDNTDTYKGLGLLDYEDSQFQADGSRLQKFYYYADGTTGRKDLLQVTHRIYENDDQNDFEEYDTAYFTDGFYARPKGLQYPGGTSVAFIFDSQGHLVEEKDPLSAVVYREITGKGSKNEILNANIGYHNGAYQYTFAATTFGATGQVESITVNGATTLVDLDYLYDGFGNLMERSTTQVDGITRETLTYDSLHRLTVTDRSFAAGGVAQVLYNYDAAGNFLKKDDFADVYSYHASRPHVLTGVSGGISYNFDDNGNVTSGDDENVTYNFSNKPIRIEDNAPVTTVTTFSYGANLMRYRQETPQGTTIYYIDKLMEIEASSSNTDYRHYLGDVAILTKTGDLNDPNPGINYILRDRLGSVATIADTSGFITEARAYDAFGKPRKADWTDKNPAANNSSITDRGFTDHEHLDDWELIHMNGRGFDYNLGRFLSVDPIIQSPANSQSLNPYSYIRNNPFSGTDPSGYIGTKELRELCTRVECVNPSTAKNENELGPGGEIAVVVRRPPPKAPASVGVSGAEILASNTVPGGFAGSKNNAIDGIGSLGAINMPGAPGVGSTGSIGTGGTFSINFGEMAIAAGQLIAGVLPYGDAAYELAVNRDVLAAAKSAGLELGMTLGFAAIGTAIAGPLGTVAGAALGYTAAKVIRLGMGLHRLWRRFGRRGTNRFSDNSLVARGGEAANHMPHKIDAAIGPSRTPGVEGFSAQCNGGTCLAEVGSYLRNRKLGVTTVGDIRAAGGDVIRTPGFGHHVTVTDLAGETASPLLKEVLNPKQLR